MAHVRAATQQLAVSELNCHPFVVDRWSFMHNGDIGGFGKIRRALLAQLSDERFDAIHGSTDSEHFFAVLLDELAPEGTDPDVEAIGRAFQRGLERVRRAGVRARAGRASVHQRGADERRRGGCVSLHHGRSGAKVRRCTSIRGSATSAKTACAG